MQVNLNEYEFHCYLIIRLGLKFLDQGKPRLAYEFFKRVRIYQENNQILTGDGWLRVTQKYFLSSNRRIALSLNKLRLY